MINRHLNYRFLKSSPYYTKVWHHNSGMQSQRFDVLLIKSGAFLAAAQRIVLVI
jgi:hypothetical protein